MPLDLDALRKKKARRNTQGWSPKDGANRIRILPHTSQYFNPNGNIEDFAYEFRSHFLKSEGADIEVFRCLRDKKEACPFCEEYKKYRDSENPTLKKLAEEVLKSSERHLFNIIDLADPNAGIQVYESGPKVYELILEFAANPAWGDLFSISEGRNGTLNLTPKGRSKSGYNTYSYQPDPDKTNITSLIPTDFVDRIDNLINSIPSYPTPEQVQKWLGVLGLTAAATVNTAPPSTGTYPPPAPVIVTAPVAPPAYPPTGGTAPYPYPSTTISPAPVQPAPTTTAPPVSPFPAPTVSAPPSAPVAPALPASASPIAGWSASHGRQPAVKYGKEVPDCFSEGPQRAAEVGFNPAKFPCEQGCPVRADCQLKQLGLA